MYASSMTKCLNHMQSGSDCVPCHACNGLHCETRLYNNRPTLYLLPYIDFHDTQLHILITSCN